MEKEKENLDPDIEKMEALVTRAGNYARETPACSTLSQAKSKSSVRNKYFSSVKNTMDSQKLGQMLTVLAQYA